MTFATYQELVRLHGPPHMRWSALGALPEAELGFAVHLAFHRGRLVMVRNHRRACWELPGGRRDPGESIACTAARELEEESGARRARIVPFCIYSVQVAHRLSHGLLCLTQLLELPGPPPDSEIAEARTVDAVPDDLCYPHIQGRILLEMSTLGPSLPWKCRFPSLPGQLLSTLADAPPPVGEIPAMPANISPKTVV